MSPLSRPTLRPTPFTEVVAIMDVSPVNMTSGDKVEVVGHVAGQPFKTERFASGDMHVDCAIIVRTKKGALVPVPTSKTTTDGIPYRQLRQPIAWPPPGSVSY